MNWQELAIKIAIGVAVFVVTTILSWLLAKLKTFLSSKVKNAKLAALLTTATDIVSNAVKSTYQTFVEGIKGTDAWTGDAQKTALQNALNTAKEQMSDDVKKYITDTYGNVDAWVTTQIESTLFDLKNK